MDFGASGKNAPDARDHLCRHLSRHRHRCKPGHSGGRARDLPKLTPRLRTYISIAQALAGSLDSTTIYRVHLASRKLTALVYPDFDTSALPRLAERTKVDLRTGEVFVFDHRVDGRVSVMMDKSLYMAGDEERYPDQAKFESDLRNLFGDRLSTLPFAKAAPKIMKAGLKPPYQVTGSIFWRP